MHEKIVSFIENHRILTFIILIFTVIFLVLVGMRTYNKKTGRFKERSATGTILNQDELTENGENTTDGEVSSDEASSSDVTSEESTEEGGSFHNDEADNKTQQYTSGLSINARDKKKQEQEEEARRLKIEEEQRKKEEERRLKERIRNKKPTYGDEVICWDTDGVPDSMVDGSSVKDYYKQVKLADFDSKWGSKLSLKDKVTKKLYLVGVDQNPDDTVKGYSEQSLGWLIQNLSKLDNDACIKFTDLNTIGSLAKDHVALLCNYDWYSAFGMKDTMVVFEDMTGTLKSSDFKAGTIFSAYTYKHNIKVKNVYGQNVVCIQYNKFGGKV